MGEWLCKLCGWLLLPPEPEPEPRVELTDEDAREVVLNLLKREPRMSNHELRRAVSEVGDYPKGLTAFNKSVIRPCRDQLGLETERGKRARPGMPLEEWRQLWRERGGHLRGNTQEDEDGELGGGT